MAAFRSVKSAAPTRRASVVCPFASTSKNASAMTQVWGSFTSVANANLNGGDQSIDDAGPEERVDLPAVAAEHLEQLPDDEQDDQDGQEADERPEPPAPRPVVRGRGGGDARHQRRSGIVTPGLPDRLVGDVQGARR